MHHWVRGWMPLEKSIFAAEQGQRFAICSFEETAFTAQTHVRAHYETVVGVSGVSLCLR